ncbi:MULTISPECIES: hypothetical protein [unclassified Streptomyces]|uniref:hypothetical protein n=1 Tax=unclassified Streptomyces TaxID=2593676 RepID=UPI00081DDD0A|nr:MULTISPECIES: hypothetical protein [unclassified Streptomyces]MYZ37613.1 hypothetical protein [Streptomyces sp. SID4917]SCF92656.1 hypothetical protein GA0115259_104943 [Streptomyces sp. MnatMP-M17]
MDQRTKVALASAVLGGYVLGRTKKGRLALTVATFVAGKGLGVDPKQLVTDGVRRLGEIPEVAELQEQVREEGMDAAREALSAVVGRRVGSLSDSISSRAVNLGGKQEEREDEYPEDQYEDEESEEDTEDEPPSGRHRTRESDELRRKKRQSGRAPGKGAPAGREAGKTASPRKKTASPRRKAARTFPTRDSRRR